MFFDKTLGFPGEGPSADTEDLAPRIRVLRRTVLWVPELQRPLVVGDANIALDPSPSDSDPDDVSSLGGSD